MENITRDTYGVSTLKALTHKLFVYLIPKKANNRWVCNPSKLTDEWRRRNKVRLVKKLLTIVPLVYNSGGLFNPLTMALLSLLTLALKYPGPRVLPISSRKVKAGLDIASFTFELSSH